MLPWVRHGARQCTALSHLNPTRARRFRGWTLDREVKYWVRGHTWASGKANSPLNCRLWACALSPMSNGLSQKPTRQCFCTMNALFVCFHMQLLSRHFKVSRHITWNHELHSIYWCIELIFVRSLTNVWTMKNIQRRNALLHCKWRKPYKYHWSHELAHHVFQIH